MSRSRRQNIPVEGSWRMVEGGENDSFDTSIVRDTDDELILDSQPADLSQFSSQLSSGSPLSTQPFSIGGSQDDNIENFLSKAEKDEQVILRSPFRPSIPQEVRHQSSRSNGSRSTEPEFYMPTVEVDSPRRTSARSSRTIRPEPPPNGLRRRQPASTGSPTKRNGRAGGRRGGYDDYDDEPQGFADRVSASLPNTLYNILAWMFGVIGLAFQYAKMPLAILLAIYFTFGGILMAQNMMTKSIYSSLSPVCRLPGASWLDLPFCPQLKPADERSVGDATKPIEFDGLVQLQTRFEEVLEKSAQVVSLPLEMKHSEASVRDLRTLVRHSELENREELVLEFDGFVEAVGTGSGELQRFNTRVGSTVDYIIALNRWTSRYIDSIAAERQGQGLIDRWMSWVFTPFQPVTFSEQSLLDRYVEHTGFVTEKVEALLVEAQKVLGTMTKAEEHLSLIYDLVTQAQKSVQGNKDEVLWTLWTIVGANTRHLRSLNRKLDLLRQVHVQRTDAVHKINDLVVELEKIKAGLGDLRDRVSEPELLKEGRQIPLSVHIATINEGVTRLEVARRRIRAEENDRINEVLKRGKEEDRLIDS